MVASKCSTTCEVCIEEARAEQVRAFEVSLPQYRLQQQKAKDHHSNKHAQNKHASLGTEIPKLSWISSSMRCNKKKCKGQNNKKKRPDVQSQYRLEVLLDEGQAAEVLAGEVLPPRHLLPVRASSLRPHARAVPVNTPTLKFLPEFEPGRREERC